MHKYFVIVMVIFSFVTRAQSLDFVTENAPPLQFIKNGKVVGKTTEIIEHISSKANFETKISILPWARAYQTALTQKDIFIYPLVRNAERESKFIWIGQIFTLNLTWVRLKSRKDVKINNLDDAKKYKTGVIRADATFNYLVENGFNKKENFITVSELPLLLDLLYSEKIDSFIVDVKLLKEMAVIKGYDPQQLISEYDIPGLSYSLYLATNLNTDPVIIEKLKRAFN